MRFTPAHYYDTGRDDLRPVSYVQVKPDGYIIMSEHMATLRKRLEARNALVAVVGMGYVGLPLAVVLGKVGFRVTGVDTSSHKVSLIEAGKSDVQGVSEFEVAGLKAVGKLSATSDYAAVGEADVIVVSVPTPLNKTGDPDVSFIMHAFEEIRNRQRPGQLVILESTTYPGTTYELVLPKLESGGLKVGEDFYLAFSPERVDPGNPVYTITNTAKVVGGMTPACTEIASLFYQQFINEVVPVSSTQTAEMAKLLENTFRSVNIALVNEVALMCDRLGVDVWEVIDAAGTKPFGFMPFYPGPGLGGHCIPIDPHYLAWKLRTLNFHSRFIELAGEITRSMPAHVVSKVGDALNQFEKSIRGSNILVLGITYKPDVADIRESPALDIMVMLEAKGASVSYNDPFIPEISVDGLEMSSTDLTVELLGSTDCVVIATNHGEYDAEWIVEHSGCLVDTRNATKGISSEEGKVVKL